MVLRIRPRPCSAVERRVGREQARRVAEERVAAARRRDLAVERGVGVEHLVIVDRLLLEPGLLGERIALRRAEEDLAEAEIDLAGEVRDHAAHVMGDDLEVRQLVEKSGIDQPRHAGRGLVGPAEAEPDLVLGRLLAGVVGKIRAAHRMHPDRQIVLDHAPEDRPEFRRAQRLAGDIGEDLDAARAEVVRPRGRSRASDASILFIGSAAMKAGKRSGCLRQTSASASLAMRASSGVLSGGAISSSGGLASESTCCRSLELVEQRKPRVDVPERLEPGKRRDRHMAGNQSAEAIEINLRHEMVEDVDHHRRAPRLPGRAGIQTRTLPSSNETCPQGERASSAPTCLWLRRCRALRCCSTRPLPLRERAARCFNNKEWVRGRLRKDFLLNGPLTHSDSRKYHLALSRKGRGQRRRERACGDTVAARHVPAFPTVPSCWRRTARRASSPAASAPARANIAPIGLQHEAIGDHAVGDERRA